MPNDRPPNIRPIPAFGSGRASSKAEVGYEDRVINQNSDPPPARGSGDRNVASLAEERRASTTAERQVLALEMIADRLDVIARALSGQALPTVAPANGTGEGRAGDRWENEGGSYQVDPSDSAPIARRLVENFRVGDYNYTDLQHAIAEAKRARRADAKLS